MRAISRGAALFFAAVLGAGASELWHYARGAPVVRSSKPVASFSAGTITEDDLAAVRAERGQVDRREIIRDLARRRMLAVRARAEGLATESAVAGRVEQILADAYIRRHVDEPLRTTGSDEQALAPYFEAHRADYERPEQVKLAVILVAAPEEAGARAAKRREAEALLAEARRRSAKDYYAFGQLARERSDDAATRAFGGELPAAPPDELAARYGAKAKEVVVQLRQPNQLAPEVVETPAGFLILRMIRREAAQHPGLAELRSTLVKRMAEERRAESYQKLIQEVDAEADLRLEPPELSNR